MLVSVDPGVNYCGVAEWLDKILVRAHLIKNPCKMWWCMAPEVILKTDYLDFDLAAEFPQVYHHGKGDPNDLLHLAGVVGGVAASCTGKISLYTPKKWKGQVPKDVMIKRIKAKLYTGELDVIEKCAKSLQHNVWDAIGIGLHHLGRL